MKRPNYKDKQIKTGEVDYNQLVSDVIKEINILRSNPQHYVELLERDKTYMKDCILYRPDEDPLRTQEGESAYDEAIEILINQEPLNELEKQDELTKASQDHCNDIGELGMLTHVGSKDETVVDRVEQYIEWDNLLCQSIEFGSKTSQEIVMSLITCDGDPTRVNRKNLLRTEINYIGAASGHHKDCEILTVIIFASEVREKSVQSSFIKDYMVTEHSSKTELQIKDQDAPSQAVSVSIKENEKEIDNNICKFTQKIYSLNDGTNHIVEIYHG